MITDLTIYQFCHNDLCHEYDDLKQSLSIDEKNKAARFISPQDTVWYSVCRGKLRYILGEILSIDPEKVLFNYTDSGKPFLSPEHQTSLKFNVSHTKNQLLIGIHPYLDIGVDIEEIKVTSYSDLVERFFHKNEKTLFSQLNFETQKTKFYQWWVAKESITKCLGLGIYAVLSQLDLSKLKSTEPLSLTFLDKKIMIQLLKNVNHHCSAISLCVNRP